VAIEELLKSLDPETGMGLLSSCTWKLTTKSRYPEIIARMTSMKVFEAAEGTVIERNCVYVMAAGVNLTVADGMLHTTTRTESPAHNKPIDRSSIPWPPTAGIWPLGSFFLGRRGWFGRLQIDRSGRRTYVIQDPSTALNESMPIKAENTGCDDFMGSPKELAQKLSRFSRRPESARST